MIYDKLLVFIVDIFNAVICCGIFVSAFFTVSKSDMIISLEIEYKMCMTFRTKYSIADNALVV